MTKHYKEDILTTKDVHRKYHTVLVISLAAVVTLQSVVSSVWFKLKHKQLEHQLQIEQTCLERIRDNNPFWTCDDLYVKELVPMSGNDTVMAGADRVKRDDRKRRNRRPRKRNRNRKSRRVQTKLRNIAGYHLVVDSAFSQPGSPKLTTKQGKSITYWKAKDTDHNKDQKFAKLESDGTVKIKEQGLYYVYSQITYYDKTGSWSHRIDINGNPHFKCIATEWGVGTDPDTNQFYNTVHQCYTGGTAHISKGHSVAIKSMYPNRTIHADADVTFWGIVKLK